MTYDTNKPLEGTKRSPHIIPLVVNAYFCRSRRSRHSKIRSRDAVRLEKRLQRFSGRYENRLDRFLRQRREIVADVLRAAEISAVSRMAPRSR